MSTPRTPDWSRVWTHDASTVFGQIGAVAQTATAQAAQGVQLLISLRLMTLAALRGTLSWLDVFDASPGNGAGTGPFVIDLHARKEVAPELSRSCLDTLRRTCEAVTTSLLSTSAVAAMKNANAPCSAYVSAVWHDLMHYHAVLMRSSDATYSRLTASGNLSLAIETLKQWREAGDIRGWSECERDGALQNYFDQLDVARTLEEVALAICQYGERWRQPEREYRPFVALEAIAAARASRAQSGARSSNAFDEVAP